MPRRRSIQSRHAPRPVARLRQARRAAKAMGVAAAVTRPATIS